VDIWAAQSIAVAFDKLGVAYGKTERGFPSFTKGFLEDCSHPVAKLIVEARETNKTHGTFLQPYLDFSAKTGRIHPHVNQMRNEDGGTVTGRLSMANPNLQQVPARHEIIGPMVRSLFLPEEGELWASNDFSSQEPRLLVHYAHLLNLPGAEKMVEAYKNDPNTDFHQMVADMAGDQAQGCQDHWSWPDVWHGQEQTGRATGLEPWTKRRNLLISSIRNVPVPKRHSQCRDETDRASRIQRIHPHPSWTQVPVPTLGADGVGSEQSAARVNKPSWNTANGSSAQAPTRA
jgi:hypothetical protein